MKYRLFLSFMFLLGVSISSQAIGAASDGDKTAKEAKKEAKALIKEGWQPLPGTPTIVEQLAEAWQIRSEMTDNGAQRYVTGNCIDKGTDLERTKSMVRNKARFDLNAQVKIQVRNQTENYVKTLQLSAEEAETQVQTITSTRISSQNRMGSSKDILQIYRKTEDGKYEVRMMVAYDLEKLLSDESWKK